MTFYEKDALDYGNSSYGRDYHYCSFDRCNIS